MINGIPSWNVGLGAIHNPSVTLDEIFTYLNQAVSIINLQPLPIDVYTDFCVGKFESAGKHLDKAVVASIYERFEAVTSYMHRILNVLYSRTEPGATCHVAMVDEAVAVTGAPFISRNKPHE